MDSLIFVKKAICVLKVAPNTWRYALNRLRSITLLTKANIFQSLCAIDAFLQNACG